MSEKGESYSSGTHYYCDFSGQFTNIQKIDDYTYSLTLNEINIQGSINDETIKERIRYVISEPYRFERGKSFLLFIPEKPLEGLSMNSCNGGQRTFFVTSSL